MTPTPQRQDYLNDIAAIVAVGVVALIGLLGLWGDAALLSLCERHHWQTAAFVAALAGICWSVAFVWVLARFLWQSCRTAR